MKYNLLFTIIYIKEQQLSIIYIIEYFTLNITRVDIGMTIVVTLLVDHN